MVRYFRFVLVVALSLFSQAIAASSAKPYRVLLGADRETVCEILLSSDSKPSTVVLDAQYFSKDDVALFHDKGHEVFAYLNVGALESWREYFARFSDLALASYEHWEGESWADVTNMRWQDFIADEQALDIFQKGVDGFFLDNFDVYYLYQTESVYDSLNKILERLQQYDKRIIINGGDVFVQRLIKDKKQNLIYGINQESVFTRIANYETSTFAKQNKYETEYYTDYLVLAKDAGLEVFVIEYANKKSLASYAASSCEKYGWRFYVSPNLSLDR